MRSQHERLALAKIEICRLTSEDDVFFRPGVHLLTMRARYLAALDLGSLPQLFLNCLTARGQLRR